VYAENRFLSSSYSFLSAPAQEKGKDWRKWDEIEQSLEKKIKELKSNPLKFDEPAPEAKPLSGLAAKRELKAIQDSIPKYTEVKKTLV
jgi:hypothetical protein